MPVFDKTLLDELVSTCNIATGTLPNLGGLQQISFCGGDSQSCARARPALSVPSSSWATSPAARSECRSVDDTTLDMFLYGTAGLHSVMRSNLAFATSS